MKLVRHVVKAKIIKKWDTNRGGALFPKKAKVGDEIVIIKHDYGDKIVYVWDSNYVSTIVPIKCIEIISSDKVVK